VETEVKMALRGREDLLRLLAVLPPPRRWGMQLNCYLDTPEGDLAARGASLRVRVTPDHARLTLKARRDQCRGTFRSEETEIPVARDLAVRWVRCEEDLDLGAFPEFGAALELTRGRPLRVSLWSLTRRAICDTPFRVTIEVDETVFPDGFRDYEVEAEHDDPALARRAIEHYAGIAGIRLRPQHRTKHARAFRHQARGDFPIPQGDPSGCMPEGWESPEGWQVPGPGRSQPKDGLD
jgi:hypothetical protein